MSVYTSVEQDELTDLLLKYNLGELVNYQGISAGIQNTNYFLDTSTGRYVLTLFEALEIDELSYFMNVMAFLSEHQVPCAHPVKRLDQRYIGMFKHKPTAIVDRLQGSEVTEPNKFHAAELGQAVGHMHQVGLLFDQYRQNDRGPHWWRQTVQRLNGHVSTEDYKLAKHEIDYQLSFSHAKLPRGMVHADLFKDNTLWLNDKLTGIIDFYFACEDVLLFDIAVTVNAWFIQPSGQPDADKIVTFLEAYHQNRPLLPEEKQAWPVMLRAAALRFWLSRLDDKYFPKDGEITHILDPDEYKTIIQSHITLNQALKHIWI